jgi:putative ABC transport system permease protein
VIAREEYERGGARPMMLLFSGAVGVLLLLACATVATMQLARVAERGSEIAVRMALGASRARIAAQLLMENALLGLAGSAVGVVLAHATVGTLIRLMPVETPGIAGARLDLRILLFALALALLTAMIFGLAPMLHAARHEPAATLRTARGTTGGRSLLVLVGVQSALAVLLLAGAALLVRTVSTLSAVDPGFVTEQQLTFGVNLTADRYTPERRELWFEELSTRIGALPGVTAVEATSVLPLSGESASNSVWMESYGPESGAKPEAERRIVTEGFFASMRIPLLRGRAFAAGDEASSTPVMIVSRTATEHLWRDRDAIGDRVELDDRWWTVVGVVDDVRDRALSAPPLATVYVPAAQWRPRARSFMVRTERPPLQLAGAVQAIVRAMDPEVAVRDVRTMQQVAAASAQPERARAILLGGYAVLAALLALAGLYGVASFGTQQRAREFAIRSALGARTWSIVELAMRRTVFASYGGAMAGLALSLALGGVLRRFLYGVEPWDPAALATAVIALSVFAVATAAGPALRSARVNPTEILGRQ